MGITLFTWTQSHLYIEQSYDSKVPFITNVSDVSRNKYFFCQNFTCTWKLSDPQKAVVDEVFQYFLWCLDSKGLLLCVIHVVRNTGRSSFITVHSSRSWFDWHSFWKKGLARSTGVFDWLSQANGSAEWN